MAPLATPADLRVFLSDDTIPDAAANVVLTAASGLVRTRSGRLFDLVEDDEVLVDGSGTPLLLLPEFPVLDVTSVEEDGTALEEGTDYEWHAAGFVRRLNGVWARRARWYRFIYHHGYAAPPDALKAVVMRVAARGLGNPEGLVSEDVAGQYGRRFAPDAAGLVLTKEDLDDLAAVP